MKALIIYDSRFGNTKKVAEAINKGISSKGTSRMKHASDWSNSDLREIDLLVIGSPTHGGHPSDQVKPVLDRIPDDALKGCKAAAFDTSIRPDDQNFFIKNFAKMFGNAAPRIAKQLEKKGAEVLAAESYWVLGNEGPLEKSEDKRAEKWGASLCGSME